MWMRGIAERVHARSLERSTLSRFYVWRLGLYSTTRNNNKLCKDRMNPTPEPSDLDLIQTVK